MKDMDKPRIVRVVVDGWTWCNGQKGNIAAARKMLVNALVHAKLVKIVHWISKSYPTIGPDRDRDQSRTLVQAPLESHKRTNACVHCGGYK